MAISKRKRGSSAAEITLASTSDIAFLLLIFFIVTTIFAAEQGLTLVLPAKDKGAENTVRVRQSNLAALKVHADNRITLDGDRIEINGIMNAIQNRLRDNPKLVVLLEIHPDANYGMMIGCLDELRLANATRVSLKTTE
jgi:biopolymer transport protein ExbD